MAWSSNSIGSLFASPTWIFDVRRWSMIIEIIRFNYLSLDVIRSQQAIELTEEGEESVGSWLSRKGFTVAFIDDYLTVSDVAGDYQSKLKLASCCNHLVGLSSECPQRHVYQDGR